jgi:hypothetical protein
MTDWQEKPANDLRDHDVVRGHGMVDWVQGMSKPLEDHVMVHIHSQTPERGSYTILFPKNRKVKYTRS